MARLRLFATLSDDAGGRCRIFCDGHQPFLFERTRDGSWSSGSARATPNRFYRYFYDLCSLEWTLAWAREEGG
jgi:hypothetical protein